MRTKPNNQAKAPSFALPGPCNTLLDDATAQVRINQTAYRSLNGRNQAGIRNAVLAREPRKRLRFEDAQPELLLFYKL
jgi:hypothetical protein